MRLANPVAHAAGIAMNRVSEHPLKEHLNLFGPALLITLLGFVFAYQFVDPAPPDHIRIASGQSQGAYHLFAGRYKEYLAREGIALEILTSEGSLENLQLLERGLVDLAFVQGGLADSVSNDKLLSLGSFYYEPIWLFYRGAETQERLTGFREQRLATGTEGSGTRALALQLLADNGMNPHNTEIVALGGSEAADALLSGEIDAAFFVASPESPLIKGLLEAEDLKLMSFTRAEAYTRLHPHLTSIILPEGLVNMERNLPERPTRLLSTTANMVIREDLHPAIIDLLVFVGGKIHGGGGWFEKRGEFPTPAYTDFPISPEAERFYAQGPSFLQRYLPFWTASLVDRLKVMLLPLFALLLPLSKLMPGIYRWRMRARIYPWYKQIVAIDRKLMERSVDLDEALMALNSVEQQVSAVSVPLSFAGELYDLRQHIVLARERLLRGRSQMEKAESGTHNPAPDDSIQARP